GLEGREPLLDHRLIEWVSRLPNELKIKKIKDKKYLLKKITNKYIPPELLDRHKMGFQSPISDWMKNDIRDYLDEYLNESRIEKEGILNYQFVKELKNDFLTDKKINSNKLWLILMFEMWYEKWM
ncbi:MAG: asparagine synthetase B, partial [Bacteroidetes bacterium B1(2017)]